MQLTRLAIVEREMVHSRRCEIFSPLRAKARHEALDIDASRKQACAKFGGEYPARLV